MSDAESFPFGHLTLYNANGVAVSKLNHYVSFKTTLMVGDMIRSFYWASYSSSLGSVSTFRAMPFFVDCDGNLASIKYQGVDCLNMCRLHITLERFSSGWALAWRANFQSLPWHF